MRSALYIGGVNVRRISTSRLRHLARALGSEAHAEAFIALDWEGLPLGVLSFSTTGAEAVCQVTLADHPEREAVLLALVKVAWRHAPRRQRARFSVTGTPLARSRFSPPFTLSEERLSKHWKAFLELPHRYLRSS